MDTGDQQFADAVPIYEPVQQVEQSNTLQLPTSSNQFPGLTPVNTNTEYHNDATDLLSYNFPDSTNVVTERYAKYIKLIKTIENFALGYSAIANSSVKQLENLNNNVTTDMPNFETVNGDNDNTVSGSARIGSPTLETPPNTNDGLSITNSAIAEGPNDLNLYLTYMRKALGEDYTRSIDFQNQIQTHIIPDLKRLLSEAEKRQKDYTLHSNAESKDLIKLREISAKASQNLDNSVQDFERGTLSKNRSDYKKDPYLIKRSLLKDAVLQIKAENNRIEFLANGETSLRSSEARILQELKRIFSLLAQLIDVTYGGTVNSLHSLDNVLTNVPEDLEWQNFLRNNSKFLVTAGEENEALLTSVNNLSIDNSTSDTKSAKVVTHNSYKRQIVNVTFRNNDHLSTRPLLEGVLARKESTLGISKKYNSYYFVVTPAGFFYGFPTRSIDATQPNLILYIPDCETKNMATTSSAKTGEFKFSLRGKDISSSVGALKMKKTYVFKASSYNDFDTWWKIISTHSGSVQPAGHILSDNSDAEE
jgi:hypothetical protein